MKIVLTGGPSAGKTALVGIIEKEFSPRVRAIPEAASILFRGGFPRQKLPALVNHQQRAIYYLQVELEAMAAESDGNKVYVCDRGTIDGSAYWEGDPSGFFESLNTTLEKELKRYDYVIHLESPKVDYYDLSNPLRIESAIQAHEIDAKIQSAWSSHPNRLIIHCHKNFRDKVKEVLDFISSAILKQN